MSPLPIHSCNRQCSLPPPLFPLSCQVPTSPGTKLARGHGGREILKQVNPESEHDGQNCPELGLSHVDNSGILSNSNPQTVPDRGWQMHKRTHADSTHRRCHSALCTCIHTNVLLPCPHYLRGNDRYILDDYMNK